MPRWHSQPQLPTQEDRDLFESPIALGVELFIRRAEVREGVLPTARVQKPIPRAPTVAQGVPLTFEAVRVQALFRLAETLELLALQH